MLTAIAAAIGGYPIVTWLFAALVVFAAGFLRGFTGFGFALAAVPALTCSPIRGTSCRPR